MTIVYTSSTLNFMVEPAADLEHDCQLDKLGEILSVIAQSVAFQSPCKAEPDQREFHTILGSVFSLALKALFFERLFYLSLIHFF